MYIFQNIEKYISFKKPLGRVDPHLLFKRKKNIRQEKQIIISFFSFPPGQKNSRHRVMISIYIYNMTYI